MIYIVRERIKFCAVGRLDSNCPDMDLRAIANYSLVHCCVCKADARIISSITVFLK